MKLIVVFFAFLATNTSFGQFVPDSTITKKLISEIKEDSFKNVSRYKKVPRFIKKGIKRIEGKKFNVSEFGQDFRATDVSIGRSLPANQIRYIVFSRKLYIITYETGGFGRSFRSKIITYSGRHVESIFDITVPLHDNINEFKEIYALRGVQTKKLLL